MKNSPVIIQAISDYLVATGQTQGQLASILNVKPPTITRWLRGDDNIAPANWLELEKKIKPYLPSSFYSLKEDRAPYNGRNEPSPVLYAPPPASGTVSNTPVLRQAIIDRMAEKGLDYIALARLGGYDKPHTLERLLEGRLDWFPEMLSSILTLTLCRSVVRNALCFTRRIKRVCRRGQYGSSRSLRLVPLRSSTV